jgi:putative NADH-flavin reductase
MASAVGAKRLIVVGGAGSLLAGGVRLIDAPNFPAAWKADALLQAEALEILRASHLDLNWTYLSPAPEIGPGERTGKYVIGGDEPAGAAISFEDYAVALVDEIESAAHPRQRFTVATP